MVVLPVLPLRVVLEAVSLDAEPRVWIGEVGCCATGLGSDRLTRAADNRRSNRSDPGVSLSCNTKALKAAVPSRPCLPRSFRKLHNRSGVVRRRHNASSSVDSSVRLGTVRPRSSRVRSGEVTAIPRRDRISDLSSCARLTVTEESGERSARGLVISTVLGRIPFNPHRAAAHLPEAAEPAPAHACAAQTFCSQL